MMLSSHYKIFIVLPFTFRSIVLLEFYVYVYELAPFPDSILISDCTFVINQVIVFVCGSDSIILSVAAPVPYYNH